MSYISFPYSGISHREPESFEGHRLELLEGRIKPAPKRRLLHFLACVQSELLLDLTPDLYRAFSSNRTTDRPTTPVVQDEVHRMSHGPRGRSFRQACHQRSGPEVHPCWFQQGSRGHCSYGYCRITFASTPLAFVLGICGKLLLVSFRNCDWICLVSSFFLNCLKVVKCQSRLDFPCYISYNTASVQLFIIFIYLVCNRNGIWIWPLEYRQKRSRLFFP